MIWTKPPWLCSMLIFRGVLTLGGVSINWLFWQDFLNHQLGERFVDRDDSYQSGLRPFPGSKKRGRDFRSWDFPCRSRWWGEVRWIYTLGGGFRHFLLSRLLGEDEPILAVAYFSTGWFNHQLVLQYNDQVILIKTTSDPSTLYSRLEILGMSCLVT